MSKQTSFTSVEREFEIMGTTYNCFLEIDCAVSRYGLGSTPDASAELSDFSAQDENGDEVQNQQTLCDLRDEIDEWTEANQCYLCEKAGLL